MMILGGPNELFITLCTIFLHFNNTFTNSTVYFSFYYEKTLMNRTEN